MMMMERIRSTGSEARGVVPMVLRLGLLLALLPAHKWPQRTALQEVELLNPGRKQRQTSQVKRLSAQKRAAKQSVAAQSTKQKLRSNNMLIIVRPAMAII